MDARDALTRIYVSHHTSKKEWAGNVIARLRHLGFTIIHDSENHGPTLVRAVAGCDKMARIIGAKPGSSIYSALSGAAAAILAMEEQGRAALGGHHE